MHIKMMLCQQVPVDMEEKLRAFRAFTCSEDFIGPDSITSMDEIQLSFNMLRSHTVNKKGESSVLFFHSSQCNDCLHFVLIIQSLLFSLCLPYNYCMPVCPFKGFSLSLLKSGERTL